MLELTYAKIHEQFSAVFPELRGAYQTLCDDEIFSKDGVPRRYFLVEQLFADYIECLLRLDAGPSRNRALKKSFQFIELMLASSDIDLVGLAEIGIMEGREAWWLQRAIPFVGPHWRATAKRMDDRWKNALAVSAQKPSDYEKYDLFGIRQAIAEQVKSEGLTLADIPGVTALDCVGLH